MRIRQAGLFLAVVVALAGCGKESVPSTTEKPNPQEPPKPNPPAEPTYTLKVREKQPGEKYDVTQVVSVDLVKGDKGGPKSVKTNTAKTTYTEEVQEVKDGKVAKVKRAYGQADSLYAGEPVTLSFTKKTVLIERVGEKDQRPVSVSQALARYGDGRTPESFFAKNPGKALALTFTLSRASLLAIDEFTEPFPEVSLVDCPDRDTWRQLLWDMSQPNALGIPRYTILIKDPSDLRRLQLAYATQNTVLNNGGIPGMTFDRWLVGRMIHLQEVSPTWERVLNAQIAQYFFMGEHFYMYFMQEHDRAMRALEAALKSPDVQPLLAGIRLPP